MAVKAIYRTLRNFEYVTWLDIINMVIDELSFLFLKLLDEMEKNFMEVFQEVLISEAEKF